MFPHTPTPLCEEIVQRPTSESSSQSEVPQLSGVISSEQNQYPSLSTPIPRHLEPFNYDQYINLSENYRKSYDLISGVLVAKSTMGGDLCHNDYIRSIMALISIYALRNKIHVYVVFEATIYIAGRKGAMEIINELSPKNSPNITPTKGMRRGSSSSSSSQSPISPQSQSSDYSTGSAEGTRQPDISVFLRRPEVGPNGFIVKNAVPEMVIEITSDPSSRSIDLEQKWRQYHRKGIAHYLIVDRNKTVDKKVGDKSNSPQKSASKSCVIVGRLQPKPGEIDFWKPAATGDPKQPTLSHYPSRRCNAGSSSSHSQPHYPSNVYYRRIYSQGDNDIIDCPFFSMTCRQLLNIKSMEKIVQDYVEEVSDDKAKMEKEVEKGRRAVEDRDRMAKELENARKIIEEYRRKEREGKNKGTSEVSNSMT